ncbi:MULTISPECIES: CC0125/CC1285 family lipoprotein [Ralstonia solanacearum species complex]|uniref:Lipoprotein n=1 Tax=Ralstonia solanacearum K60 TaxID=1091042 RepID=A0AAP7ZHV8_RALSL|nr:hypothetical protein [Ralstonia solanacearum]OYQ09313.1 hypothetical protein B7R77_20440 [Ralstonia solanacearum K60]QOK84237.1 hypothetical protein HF906_19175 [Ralstonia solanacearum]RIJ84740.1 hypothetical protein RSP822_19595 [Ralstonia solanacearum]
MIKEWNCGAVSLIVLTAGVVLTGCSAVHLPTPYQPYTKPNGGYTDKQIGDDVYRVVFAGTGATPLPTAYAYAVYRAAEIARDHDAPYFEVVEGFQDRKPEDDGPQFGRVEPQNLPANALATREDGRGSDVEKNHVVYVSEADFSTGWSMHKTAAYVPMIIMVPNVTPQMYQPSLLIRLLKEKPADKDKAYHVFETTRILTVLGPRLKRPTPEAAKDAQS